MTLLSYRLEEARGAATVHALYGFAFSADGELQLAVYFDDDDDLDEALALWRGVWLVSEGAPALSE